MTEAMTTPESQSNVTIQESSENVNNVNILGGKETVVEPTVPAENNNIPKSFLETLPEDLRKEKSLSSFKSVDDLAKSYVNAQKLIGKKVSEMTKEELAQFNLNMGVPEQADQYDFGNMKDQDETLLGWFKNTAHKAGLSQDSAKKIVEMWNESVAEATKMQESQIELQNQEYVKQLKEEFGAAFDTRINLAKKAVRHFGGESLIEFLNETGLGNNPNLVRAFAEAGKFLSEGSLPSPENKGQFGYTPAEARQKIAELRLDPVFQKRYKSLNIKERESAFAEIEQLYKIAGSTK